MVNEKIIDWKTGRLNIEAGQGSLLYLLMFIAGILFDKLTPDFHGYMHEFGHVSAAIITGGEGEILNAHLCSIKSSKLFEPFVSSSGVGFIFLVYYFLSSRRTLGRYLVPRAFFTGIMLIELLDSYQSASTDFDKSPLTAVLFTATWVFLLYKRIKGAACNRTQ